MLLPTLADTLRTDGRRRNVATAHEFISDLASHLRYRVQMTTDGHRPYLDAVESAALLVESENQKAA